MPDSICSAIGNAVAARSSSCFDTPRHAGFCSWRGRAHCPDPTRTHAVVGVDGFQMLLARAGLAPHNQISILVRRLDTRTLIIACRFVCFVAVATWKMAHIRAHIPRFTSRHTVRQGRRSVGRMVAMAALAQDYFCSAQANLVNVPQLAMRAAPRERDLTRCCRGDVMKG
jgi:hypothetical protein